MEWCASVNWSARVNRTWRRVVMVYILKIHGISIRISIVEIQVNHPGSDYIYMPGWTWMDLASHRTSLLMNNFLHMPLSHGIRFSLPYILSYPFLFSKLI